MWGRRGRQGWGDHPGRPAQESRHNSPSPPAPAFLGLLPRPSLHLMGTHLRGPLLPPSLASEAVKLEWGIASKAHLGLSGSCTHPGAECAPERPGCMGGRTEPPGQTPSVPNVSWGVAVRPWQTEPLAPKTADTQQASHPDRSWF